MIRTEPIGSLRCQWGEAPIWWLDHLYFVDIEGHAVHRFNPETGESHTWPVHQRVGTVVPRSNGHLLLAGDHGIFSLNPEDGAITPLVDPESHLPNNRFNDGKCSPDGSFFVGSMSLTREPKQAKLYRFAPDHSITEAFGPVTTSNGIVWSADGLTAYYIDTPRREVLAFDYQNSELSNPRTIIQTSHIEASPDGMAIDAQGNLWIAFCHGGCVSCFDPTTGNELHRISLPCLETTACAFGGPGLADLFVTTGIHRTAVEEHGGRLFVIRGLNTHGVPSNAFLG